ncbi:hypothetical protein THAOC_14918, partial [Thalassiosira oceanica]
MDRRLVSLVRQTERYGERLHRGGDGPARPSSSSGGGMTIEEALSSGLEERAAKRRGADYARMHADMVYDADYFSAADGGSPVHGTRRRARRETPSPGGGDDASDGGDGGDDGPYEPTESELAAAAGLEENEELLASFRAQDRDEVDREVATLLSERDMDLDELLRRMTGPGG